MLSNEVTKKYGDVIINGGILADKPKTFISVSPRIDMALNGGIPDGSWVSIAGPPGCGKSTTALQIAANARLPKYNINGKPRKLFYLDVEHRLKKMNLKGVHNLNAEDVEVIRSTKEKQLSAEDFLQIAKMILKDPENTGCVIIIDSAAALCPLSELTEDISGDIRSKSPKIMASFCRNLAGTVSVMDNIVIIIHHLITNTSGYGAKYLVDGGIKIEFQDDVRIITKSRPKIIGNESAPSGHIVEWDITKSANGSQYSDVKSYIKFGYGIDEVREYIDIALEFGIINKSGSWFSFIRDGSTEKYQGEEKLYTAISSSDTLKNFLINEIEKITSVGK